MSFEPTTIAAVSGIQTTTDAFRVAFVDMCRRVGLNPDWLAAVVSFESGFNPAAENPRSHASGLIQFMPGERGSATLLGYTPEQIRSMSAEEQVPLIERYMVELVKPRNLARVQTITDTYLTVFGPDGIGRGEDYPLYTIDRTPRSYEGNKSLDHDKDGIITNGEASARVKAILAAAESLPRIPVPDGSVPLAKTEPLGPLKASLSFTVGAVLAYLGLTALAKKWPKLKPTF